MGFSSVDRNPTPQFAAYHTDQRPPHSRPQMPPLRVDSRITCNCRLWITSSRSQRSTPQAFSSRSTSMGFPGTHEAGRCALSNGASSAPCGMNFRCPIATQRFPSAAVTGQRSSDRSTACQIRTDLLDDVERYVLCRHAKVAKSDEVFADVLGLEFDQQHVARAGRRNRSVQVARRWRPAEFFCGDVNLALPNSRREIGDQCRHVPLENFTPIQKLETCEHLRGLDSHAESPASSRLKTVLYQAGGHDGPHSLDQGK